MGLKERGVLINFLFKAVLKGKSKGQPSAVDL